MITPSSKTRSWRNEDSSVLFKAILGLKTIGEAEAFFRDLLSLAEIREFSQRWKIARLLAQGRSYRDAARAVKVSTATVARVAHWLDHCEGGYRTILARNGIEVRRRGRGV